LRQVEAVFVILCMWMENQGILRMIFMCMVEQESRVGIVNMA